MRPRFKAQIKQCPAQSAIRKNISTVTFTRQISGKNREKKNCIENFPKIRSESNLNCNEGLPFHSTIAHRQFTHTAYAILFRCRSGWQWNNIANAVLLNSLCTIVLWNGNPRLQFKFDSEWILGKFSWQFYLFSRFLPEICRLEVTVEIFFRIALCSGRCLIWALNRGLMSNKPML